MCSDLNYLWYSQEWASFFLDTKNALVVIIFRVIARLLVINWWSKALKQWYFISHMRVRILLRKEFEHKITTWYWRLVFKIDWMLVFGVPWNAITSWFGIPLDWNSNFLASKASSKSLLYTRSMLLILRFAVVPFCVF